MTTHAEAHQVHLYYGESVVENRKVGNFLDWIKFSSIQSGKSTAVSDYQTNNSFALDAYYIYHLLKNKNTIQFKDISTSGQLYGGQGSRGGIQDRGGRGR